MKKSFALELGLEEGAGVPAGGAGVLEGEDEVVTGTEEGEDEVVTGTEGEDEVVTGTEEGEEEFTGTEGAAVVLEGAAVPPDRAVPHDCSILIIASAIAELFIGTD
jgi:hypothetical protein